ncbi:pyridoxal-phosphate-dependent aminotransferase family protein [Methyloceanibacter marginalis]|uniref:pyridoxal-phosphate-dependent aminotransferase family protein n=1 Tax=Methyloceanibacter marginalis TaxID=1774971 RepID=UPI00084C97B2|nr:aminotransferase class V-fold PLP-dependent enzyme [Methyloceanibacter marginalis]
MLDHRSPQFQDFAYKVLSEVRSVFQTRTPVIMFPSSGTGGWEAALVNTLSPRDRVLFVGTGQFSLLWSRMATHLGLAVSVIKTDWRTGADPARIEECLRADVGHVIKAVCVVHNETSTGVRSWVDDIRDAIDAASHPALLLVDAVSSLAAMDYRHDDWRVDVTISGSQKGLMLPPGLSFNAVSEKALAASRSATLPRSYWSWKAMLEHNADGSFPFTPAISLIYGLAESITMLHEWGLDNVFARHQRHAEAVRRAVKAWGLQIWCRTPHYYSPGVTAICMPIGHNADDFRQFVRERFNISLGMGQGRLAGRAFRFGHIGYTNDATVLGALGAIEMALEAARVPHKAGGVDAALSYLAQGDCDSKVRATESLLATRRDGSGNLFAQASI